MQFLFAATLFVSAALMFIVQPMFGKTVLPLLGGSPAVWNTCMVFYQTVLLAGYVYAHVASRCLGTRRHAALHLIVLCLPWLVLPLGVPDGWTPPADGSPVPWLLMLLTVSVGLPLFVVSASAPMLQNWFADTNHPASADPYFLYAASNLGSMIALFAYPLAVEPMLTLAGQRAGWAAAYALFSVLVLACAALLWRCGRPDASRPPHGHFAAGAGPFTADPSPPSLVRKLHWVALSLVPSSLLLGVTSHISTDVAVVPLLWVVPLAIYLLSFILVFARHALLPEVWMIRLQPYLVILLAASFSHSFANRPALMMPLHLATFFVTAMVCHGELARTRPAPKYLTEFYLWVAVGGVLGGALNAFAAPALFSRSAEYLSGIFEYRRGIFEYPLMIALGVMLRPKADASADDAFSPRLDLALPAALLLGFGGAVFAMETAGLLLTDNTAFAVLALAGLITFAFRKRAIRFGLSIGAILLVDAFCLAQVNDVIETRRNFFGVIRIRYDAYHHSICMSHGTTNHGMQSLVPGRENQPLTYYHQDGPLGDVFEAASRRQARQIGVVGLGIGSMSSYGRPGQTFTYYEINPAVEKLARDETYFTFLKNSEAKTNVVLGDARLTLAGAPDAHFDLLVVDAFNSDVVPVHLMTREAIQLYFSKLADDGLLVLHVSNRCFNLEPILGKIADHEGVVCRINADGEIPPLQAREGRYSSIWIVMARRPEHVAGRLDNPHWQAVPGYDDAPMWTDDYSSILSVLRWW